MDHQLIKIRKFLPWAQKVAWNFSRARGYKTQIPNSDRGNPNLLSTATPYIGLDTIRVSK